jgi:hypothetical protein
MLRDASVEPLGDGVIRAGKPAKFRERDDEMQNSGHATDRAVAALDLDVLRSFHLEPGRPAVTANLMDHTDS